MSRSATRFALFCALAGLGAHPFSVPGCGAIESLNLASVVNICIYELNRRRGGRNEP